MRIGFSFVVIIFLSILLPATSYCQFSDDKTLSDPFSNENQDPFTKASPYGGQPDKYRNDEYLFYQDTSIISTPIYDYGKINNSPAPNTPGDPNADTPIDDWLIYFIPLFFLYLFRYNLQLFFLKYFNLLKNLGS